MHIKRSTAGRKEDVREKVSRMTCTAANDSERLFLAALAEGLLRGDTIRIGDEEWVTGKDPAAPPEEAKNTAKPRTLRAGRL